jgi:hypothetical protein
VRSDFPGFIHTILMPAQVFGYFLQVWGLKKPRFYTFEPSSTPELPYFMAKINPAALWFT